MFALRIANVGIVYRLCSAVCPIGCIVLIIFLNQRRSQHDRFLEDVRCKGQFKDLEILEGTRDELDKDYDRLQEDWNELQFTDDAYRWEAYAEERWGFEQQVKAYHRDLHMFCQTVGAANYPAYVFPSPFTKTLPTLEDAASV
ncbi:MAG TPA: hypothetical protein VHA78_00845 [Candidatus Peribacteraceae bacterium]|nr:hypothetical protein [Candidatus Peribacteraceae bacterium]